MITCIPNDHTCVLTDTINQITLTNKEYSQELIWAVLNSTLINWYAYRFIFGKAIRTMHFDNSVTSRVPLVKLNETNAQIAVAIEVLSSQIISRKISDFNTNVKELEYQMDQLVYQLYDLTEEEIKIIEES